MSEAITGMSHHDAGPAQAPFTNRPSTWESLPEMKVPCRVDWSPRSGAFLPAYGPSRVLRGCYAATQPRPEVGEHHRRDTALFRPAEARDGRREESRA